MCNELVDAQLHMQAQLGVHVGLGPRAPADGETKGATHARGKQVKHSAARLRQDADGASVRMPVTVAE